MIPAQARPRAVVLGQMTTMPFGGVLWQTLHYLLGLERLGFETWYVEAHAVAPRHFMAGEDDDGAEGAAAFIDRLLGRFGLSRRWAFHALASHGRCYGIGESRLQDLYTSAEVLLNLHGGTRPRPEHVQSDRLVCVSTDPVLMEVELNQKVRPTIEFFDDHRAVFTFGENYGNPDCLLPALERFPIRPTRQPIVLEHWEDQDEREGEVFTTIANWRQERRIRFAGETYEWSKHLEFLKILDLPERSAQPFELALTRCPDEHRLLLAEHGWRVRDALRISADLDTYRRYITGSRGELTVAKDQNVRLRSGWFSDRSATYLAAGRPVVTQDTGFGNILPTGEGLFAFSSVEEAAEAIDAINGDYERHRRAAREIARAYFAHDVVLPALLEDAGLSLPARPARGARHDGSRVLLAAHRFPPDARGGVELYTAKLADELAGSGDAVGVVCRRPDGGPLRREVEHLASGVAVHRLAGGRVRRERFLAERAPREHLLREVLAESDPDLVHVNHVLDLSPRVLQLARERGAAVVLTLHDYYFACPRIVLRTPDEESCPSPEGGRRCARTCFAAEGEGAAQRWTLRALYFRRLLQLPDRIVCPSRYVADFFERFGAPDDRLRVVANGVWIDPGRLDGEDRAAPRRRGPLALAFLGPVLAHKGLGRLLEALALARLDAVELTTFGPVEDVAVARELYSRAAEIPGLRFRMYGEYEPEELPLLLEETDCVVVPSQWPETFCLVAREAHVRGLPAIVSRIGALPDGVVDGENGFTFEPDRADELAAILRRLTGEPELLDRLRDGARRTRVPTLREHVTGLREVYGEALAERARDRRPQASDLEEIAALEDALTAVGFGDGPRAAEIIHDRPPSLHILQPAPTGEAHR